MIQWIRRGVLALVVTVWLAPAVTVHAQAGGQDLKRMSLEDLLNVEVTTVTRRPETTDEVPAAIFVITQNDIRRSGARSLPELLRLAPGVQVAQIDGSKWSTGIRGFADRLSRAMLVLIDGRAVYSPLFAGTYWEVQDTLLEDVERIEVIRGPGGTLWGANAVNGIINIVTKQAAQTQGVLATVEGGAYGYAVGGFRFGGQANAGKLNYRFYGKGLQRAHEYQPSGPEYDTSTMQQAGGRADWSLARQRTLTLQGDAYHQRLGEQAVRTFYTPPYREVTNVEAPLAGGNVLARLSGETSGGAYQLQTYYDRTSRDEVPVGETRDTFDVDFQQVRRPRGRNQVTFGGGYRLTSGVVTAVAPSAIVPARRTDSLFSAFGQDEIELVPQRLSASLGAKVEHNAYSGFEIQPSARLLWTPHPAHTMFLAVTRAVRTPSRVETDYTTTSLVTPNGPTFVRLEPNPGFVAERLVAYELGYRVRPAARVYVTASGFYNSLDDALSTELLKVFTESTPPDPTRTIFPVMFRNGIFGESHGVELTADARPESWLRTTANYSYMKVAVTPDPGAQDISQQRRYEGLTPRHQVQAQVALDLPSNLSADLMLRHASELPSGPVPAYTTSTLRVAWQVTPQVELAVVGANLNDAHHLEWPGGVQIQRTIYAKLTWTHR